MKVGLIGFGAMGRALASGLPAEGATLTCILERPEQSELARARCPNGVRVHTSVDDFLAERLDVIIECAGHKALRSIGPLCLRRGYNLIIASIGALADESLENALREATMIGGRMVIPSGALGGLDALGAAKRVGLDTVHYVSTKAPRAWLGTKAEELIDLNTVQSRTTFYEGNAREAALAFPQNANVVAAVALAGIGFQKTRVRLTVDPTATGNRHLIEASGPFGRISCDVVARTLPDNPKTSMLAPYSLLRAVGNLRSHVIL